MDGGMDAGPDGGIDAGQPLDGGQCGRASDLTVVTYFPAAPFYSGTSGDLNGDGLLDLVGGIWGDSGGVQVLFGQPDGGLSSPLALVNDYSIATSLAIGDMDGDGIPDVVAIGDQLTVFLNDGGGGFTATTYPQWKTGNFGAEVYLQIGDLNGDGAPDLFFSASDLDAGTIRIEVLVNQGSGAFADPVPIFGIAGTLPAGLPVYSFLVADLNRDGLADIVANTTDGTHLAVLLSLGDGGFATTQYPFPLAGAIALLPNPSGAPDLVADVTVGDESPSTGVFVLRNSGSGTFTRGAQLTPSPAPAVIVGDFTVGDFNGDCVPDVAMFSEPSDAPNFISVFYGQSDSTFLAPRSLAAGSVVRPGPMFLMGPTSDPRALALVAPIAGYVVIYGDASR